MPLDDGVADLVAVIEAVRPEVIVTFGPEGMTGQPDQRTVSAWATEAWRRTGQHAELWYANLTPTSTGPGVSSTTGSGCGRLLRP